MIYEQQIELTRLSDGESGQSSFIHIKYSNDKKTFTGNGGEDVGIYLGIYTDNIEEDSTDFNKYTWSKIVGADGKQGEDGISITAVDEHYAISTSNTTEPTNWSNVVPTMTATNKYLWNYETIHYSNNTTTDTSKRVIGVYGDKGLKGDTGATGNGIVSTEITYQSSADGSAIPSGTWQKDIPTVIAGNYLWTKTTTTYTDKTTTSSYSVARQGIDGSDGKNGVSPTITKTVNEYAQSTSGTTTPSSWSATPPSAIAGQYIWTKTTDTYSDGKTSISYNVSKNGTNGSNGKSIGSIINYYLATNVSSGVKTDTSGWTTSVQSVSADKKYLWNYEVIKYSDNTIASTSEPCIIGSYGDKGATGSTGNGIASIAEHYAVSTSNTTAPTSWKDTVPTLTATDKYLWNYETITYTDKTAKDTTKRVIGVYGDKGLKGDKGDDGTSITIKSKSVEYAVSSSGTTTPTSGWGTSVPSVDSGKFLWTKTTVTYSDNTSTVSYSVGYKGTNGTNGTSPTVSSTKNEYQQSTNGTTIPTGTWQSAPPAANAGQYIWTKTTVTYTDGKTAISYNVSKNGTNGSNGKSIGTVVNYYLATSASSGVTVKTSGWTTAIQNVTAEKKYLWNYEEVKYTDGTIINTTEPCIIGAYGDRGEQGLQGIQGKKGEQGIPGKDGTNGKTTYFHIKYSAVANPTSASQMSETPNTYIGTYVDYTEADSTDPKKYTWSQFKGSKGDQGIPGTNGENGKTSYLHIAYANSADGKTGFDVSNSSGKLYIGQYTDFNSADSTDPAKYSWSKIKGETGATGKGVGSITKEFYLSTSKVTPTGGKWQETMPEWEKGKYVWTREKIVYTNPASTVYTEATCDTTWEAVDNIKLGTKNLIHNAQTMVYSDYQLTSFSGTSVFSVDGSTLKISSVTATVDGTTLKLDSGDATVDGTTVKLGGK